jgi:hypothetical protein
MKTIRPILNALAALAVLAVLGACSPIVAPQRLPGGSAGQVILTVSAGPENATLTLSGESPIDLTLGQSNSIEVEPGYYDLTVSLENSDGATAGASEKVHIYSGLESAVGFNFTNDDFIQAIPLAGTVTLPGSVSVAGGFIGVYSDSTYATLIQTVTIQTGETTWATNILPTYAGYTTPHFKLDVFDSDGYTHTVTGDTGSTITEAGKKNITLSSATPGIPTPLDISGWHEGSFSLVTETNWYTFIVWAAGTYTLQWNDGYNSAGSKTAHTQVSAYRANGTPIFVDKNNGYAAPQPINLAVGETFYVIVMPDGSATSAGIGDYTIRCYW